MDFEAIQIIRSRVLSGLKTRGEALKLQFPCNIAPLPNRTGEERRRKILCD